MRRIPLIAAAAGAAAAVVAAGVVMRPAPSAVTVAAVPATDQRYGIIRMDATTHQWSVLDTPTFQPFGLTTVTCSASTGVLTVGFDPLATVGTFTVDEDEAYAGRVDAGASIVTDALRITFRLPATGQSVACSSPQLAIANSNLQLWVLGTNPAPSPTAPPTTTPPPTPSASVQPSTTGPVASQPPSASALPAPSTAASNPPPSN